MEWNTVWTSRYPTKDGIYLVADRLKDGTIKYSTREFCTNLYKKDKSNFVEYEGDKEGDFICYSGRLGYYIKRPTAWLKIEPYIEYKRQSLVLYNNTLFLVETKEDSVKGFVTTVRRVKGMYKSYINCYKKILVELYCDCDKLHKDMCTSYFKDAIKDAEDCGNIEFINIPIVDDYLYVNVIEV